MEEILFFLSLFKFSFSHVCCDSVSLADALARVGASCANLEFSASFVSLLLIKPFKKKKKEKKKEPVALLEMKEHPQDFYSFLLSCNKNLD